MPAILLNLCDLRTASELNMTVLAHGNKIVLNRRTGVRLKNGSSLKTKLIRFQFQKRFFVSDKTDETRWWIPINFVQPGGNFSDTFSSVWLSSEESSKHIQGLPDRNAPVVFNVQETGKRL